MGSSKIKSIKAREILDSKGQPTVEVELQTGQGIFRAAVPSGVSRGKYEAVEIRDGEERYWGQGVRRAVDNVKEIIEPRLKGKDVTRQKEIDQFLIKLDGTKNKSRLGANALLGVSMAVCRAGAHAKKMPLWKWIGKIAQTKPSLPSPAFLFIEGGLHGSGGLDLQEFMGVPRADSFSEKLRMASEIYRSLGEILKTKYDCSAVRGVGMEGAFIPPLKKTSQALDSIMEATEKAGYRNRLGIILDAAANSFFRKGKYYLEKNFLDREELLKFYLGLCQGYPIMAIEDPFHQDDWEGFSEITRQLGKIIIIGDDFLVTNLQRIKEAVARKAAGGLILKPNQIGTISETIEAANYASQQGWEVFVKHRAGETADDFIADLAVGLGKGWIMAGAPTRGERVVKYNQLLRIEEELQND